MKISFEIGEYLCELAVDISKLELSYNNPVEPFYQIFHRSIIPILQSTHHNDWYKNFQEFMN